MTQSLKDSYSTSFLNDCIVKGLQEKKAKNIVSLDLTQLKDAVADFFIVCHADSTTQVKALANAVFDEVNLATRIRPNHLEGIEHANWVLLDYGNTVVHIFLRDLRFFYGLEELWNDAVITAIEDEPNPNIKSNKI